MPREEKDVRSPEEIFQDCVGIWIPIEILGLVEDGILTVEESVLLSMIHTLSRNGKGSNASNAYFCRIMRKKVRTVQSALANLSNLKLIEVNHKKFKNRNGKWDEKRTIYSLVKSVWGNYKPNVDNTTPPRKNLRGGMLKPAGRYNNLSSLSVERERDIERKTNKKKNNFSIDDGLDLFPKVFQLNTQFGDAFESFHDHRRAMGKPLTERAVKIQSNRVKDLGWSPAYTSGEIERAIVADWKSFVFPNSGPMEKKNGTKPTELSKHAGWVSEAYKERTGRTLNCDVAEQITKELKDWFVNMSDQDLERAQMRNTGPGRLVFKFTEWLKTELKSGSLGPASLKPGGWAFEEYKEWEGIIA